MIQQKIVSNHSVIKVINYDSYQNRTINSTINGQQIEQQTDTNNNVNNILINKEENFKKISDIYYAPEVVKFLDTFKKECKKPTSLSPEERIKLINTLNDLILNQNFTLDSIIKTICKNFNNLNFDKKKINVGINWLLKDSNFYAVLNGQNTKNNPESELKSDWNTYDLLS